MLPGNYKHFAAITIIFATAALFSCNESVDTSGSMQTANHETIVLTPGDKSVQLDRVDLASIKKYERYVNSLPHHQVPLNKVFFRNHTGIYYGIPVDGSVMELATEYQQTHSSGIIESRVNSDSTNASFFVRDSVNFVSVSVFRTAKKHILMAAAISNDSSTVRKIYDSSTLQNNVKNDAD